MKLYELEQRHNELKKMAIERLKEVIADNDGLLDLVADEMDIFLINQPESMLNTVTGESYMTDQSEETYPLEELAMNDILYLIGNYTKNRFEGRTNLGIELYIKEGQIDLLVEQAKKELESRKPSPTIIRLEGGLVQKIIPGTEGYEVRDYDTDGMDWDELMEDEEGKMYFKTTPEIKNDLTPSQGN